MNQLPNLHGVYLRKQIGKTHKYVYNFNNKNKAKIKG